MRSIIRYAIGCLLIACLAAIGCGPVGPPKYKVEGRITFDGEPIESGYIWFRDKSGQVGSVEARIKQGVYQLESLPGLKLVEISMFKEAPLPGNKPNEEGDTTTLVEALPKRYNTESTLEVNVVPEMGSQDFELTTKPSAL
ncbi:hypothetical protein M4951_17815 [Blastopirellula sp. J2-11]|uniref:hypothetical protein n=1 Tax=Blastopirellula sp. J2-11 TaxID=2943192 RepID=UPI0021C67CF1|nr:hypothetical protein [Blastopirellula sp. J2-11]UUO05227.1 hypothetical protein M4951_17815 [Blastopirellula sp. J2-11]